MTFCVCLRLKSLAFAKCYASYGLSSFLSGSNNPKNDKQQGTDESEVLGELPLSAVEKKNRSRFARLIRKLSAPIKANPNQDFIQRKATTPQPTRKGIDPNKIEDNRNEIFATPATNRRFFSASVHQRARTTSDTDLLQ